MFVAEVRVEVPDSLPLEVAAELLRCLLGAWWRHGQIRGSDQALVASDQAIGATVLLTDHDALNKANNNTHVDMALSALVEAGCLLGVKILGQDIGSEVACACTSPETFILFSSNMSPLQCGDCGGAVPLYRLPADEYGEYMKILGWAADYDACDTLQLSSATLEVEATEEMALLPSSLTRRALKICREIKGKTGRPCYYYLYNSPSDFLSQPRDRKCPSCGGEWRLPSPWHRLYEFRCDQCRLLSNL